MIRVTTSIHISPRVKFLALVQVKGNQIKLRFILEDPKKAFIHFFLKVLRVTQKKMTKSEIEIIIKAPELGFEFMSFFEIS